MKKLLAGTFAAGLVTSAAVFGDATAAADTALIVPGTAPSPYGPLRSLYHFKPETQPNIGENFYNPAATRVVIYSNPRYDGGRFTLSPQERPPFLFPERFYSPEIPSKSGVLR